MYLSWSITSFLRDWYERYFWNSFEILMSFFTVEVCIAIYLPYPDAPGSCTFFINMRINVLSVAFKLPMNSLSCPGAPTLWSMRTLYMSSNINSKYNSVAYLYLLAQPSVLSQIVLIYKNKLSVLQQFNIVFTVCVCSDSILFAAIRPKQIKHCIMWQTTWL